MFRNRYLMRIARAHAHPRFVRAFPAATCAIAAKFFMLLCVILLLNVAHIGGYASPNGNIQAAAAAFSDTHRLAKRMDLESCLGQFEVHKNTIIRTGESQAIGGKYLQGLELETAEECQRLCCETDSCDVYVFEHKTDGYCYLFECGPPENFHCKFTRHANYTSSVLVTVRHNIETTTTKPTMPHLLTNNISQQEWELTSLKVKPETREKLGAEGVVSGANVAGATTSGGVGRGVAATMTVGGATPAEVAFPQKVSNVNAHCGHFQFTCHSGECIAVYNACDGIPQCEDGSDEGPECSGATSASAVATVKTNVESNNANLLETANIQKTAAMPHFSQPPNVVGQAAQQHLQALQQQQQSAIAQTPQQQLSHAALTPPLINNREDAGAWANRKMAAETETLGQQTINAADLNSRIFNHKGGLQLPAGNNINNNAALNNYASANNNNNNINANILYNAATLQHAGLYLPQDVTGGVYVPQSQAQQQQQLMLQQGHIMLPPNVNWQMQQQQQQALQQQQQQPQILTVGGMPAQQQPTYIINAPHQQQQLQPAVAQAKAQVPIAPAQQPAVSAPQQATAAPAVKPAAAADPKVASGVSSGAITSQDVGHKQPVKIAEKIIETTEEEEYDDYEDEQKSTEPPKKKQHKHKKLKSKSSKPAPKATTGAAAPSSQLDPIELALQQQKNQPQNVPPQPAPVHEQYKMIHDNLAMEFRDHDGQSERPGGAMLSLTLGLLVTAALAILMGCRMRTVGRRARRMGGKTPYSHEADFLVNGMYL